MRWDLVIVLGGKSKVLNCEFLILKESLCTLLHHREYRFNKKASTQDSLYQFKCQYVKIGSCGSPFEEGGYNILNT